MFVDVLPSGRLKAVAKSKSTFCFCVVRVVSECELILLKKSDVNSKSHFEFHKKISVNHRQTLSVKHSNNVPCRPKELSCIFLHFNSSKSPVNTEPIHVFLWQFSVNICSFYLFLVWSRPSIWGWELLWWSWNPDKNSKKINVQVSLLNYIKFPLWLS